MGVVVSVVVLSAALVAAPAPVSVPSTSASAAAAPSAFEPWPLVAAGAVLVGGATLTSAAVVAVGHQAVIEDPAALGADRLRAQQQLPIAVGLVVAGAVVVVAGVAVAVWRTSFVPVPVENAP